MLKLYGQTKKIRGEKYNDQYNRLKDIQEFRDAWSYEENFCNYWTIRKLKKLRKESFSFIQRVPDNRYCWQAKLLKLVGDNYIEQKQSPLSITKLPNPTYFPVRNLDNMFRMYAHNL